MTCADKTPFGPSPGEGSIAGACVVIAAACCRPAAGPDDPGMMTLGTVIADFLSEAEAGRVRDGAGRPFTRDGLHDLRGALAHAASGLGTLDVDAVHAPDVAALLRELRAAGLGEARVDAVRDALRAVYAYAIGRGLVASGPIDSPPGVGPEVRTPTAAMVALGEQVVGWTMRAIVIAFVLVAIGLVLVVA